MPRIKLKVFDAESGKLVDDAVLAGITYELFRIGDEDPITTTPIKHEKGVIVFKFDLGVYNLHVKAEDNILSFSVNEPGDVKVISPGDGHSKEIIDVYRWKIDADPSVQPPPPPPSPPTSSGDGDVSLKTTCTFCNSRYTTPGTPYYLNYAWWYNCYYAPCTQG